MSLHTFEHGGRFFTTYQCRTLGWLSSSAHFRRTPAHTISASRKSSLRLLHVKLGNTNGTTRDTRFCAAPIIPTIKWHYRSGHSSQREENQGDSGQGSKRGFLLMLLAGGAGGCSLYYLTGRDNILSEGKIISSVLAQPPERFVHPLDSEALHVRLWIATKRILFLAYCFAPFALSTLIYLLYNTSETRYVLYAYQLRRNFAERTSYTAGRSG